ncbi:hypothetical protein FH972_025145 [Carpinus fangiana]|uniref:COX assembly mitochondrial protein n=1 Tax=Carpinus fangiana TaxID=176857 RepID=A0A5N6L134_9ROSI|nr:hypothetical protein FH972_025145 [Carpinus fangiana]
MSSPNPERVEYTHRYSTKSSTPASSDTNASRVRTSPDGKPIRGIDVRRVSPMPLNATQESEVRDLYYKRVRDKCSDEIRDFAHCATGRTFTIPFACRAQRLAMEGCMVKHATRAEEDAAREEWFRNVPDRQRKKDEDEQWKESQRVKKREWWADYEKEKRPASHVYNLRDYHPIPQSPNRIAANMSIKTRFDETLGRRVFIASGKPTGRPRKSTTTSPPPPKVNRPVGRPRKHAASATLSGQPKRGRGRPRKNPTSGSIYPGVQRGKVGRAKPIHNIALGNERVKERHLQEEVKALRSKLEQQKSQISALEHTVRTLKRHRG